MLLPTELAMSQLLRIFKTLKCKAMADLVSNVSKPLATGGGWMRQLPAAPSNQDLRDSVTPHRSLTVNGFRKTSVPTQNQAV